MLRMCMRTVGRSARRAAAARSTLSPHPHVPLSRLQCLAASHPLSSSSFLACFSTSFSSSSSSSSSPSSPTSVSSAARPLSGSLKDVFPSTEERRSKESGTPPYQRSERSLSPLFSSSYLPSSSPSRWRASAFPCSPVSWFHTTAAVAASNDSQAPQPAEASAALSPAPSSQPAGTPAAASTAKPRGFFTFLNKEHIIAEPGYNRWRNVPAGFLVQLSVGSVYAWSIFNSPLTRELGVVVPAAADWQLGHIVHVFSGCAVFLGISTALLGPWAEAAGPRKVAMTAALAWSSGLLLTAYGVYTHQLPFLYLGYSALGGIGWGLGYISPVSTLLRWFPDRRGMASGLALTAFGGGAMLATPINEFLLNTFFELPAYLGAADAVQLVTEAGRRFAEVDGSLREVVVATQTDVQNLPGKPAPGVYVVGTGNSGAAKTFLTLSGGYLLSMSVGAFLQRVPREGWLPPNWTPPSEHHRDSRMISHRNVHHDQALRTPQFYLLWTSVAGLATAGVTVLSCAKTMMSDIFAAAMPAVVTGAFAATFVAALSGSNMVGRLLWANVSDVLGRKNTYFLFGLSTPLLCALPHLTQSVTTSPGLLPLSVFYGGTMLMVTFYGGVFAVLPAYLSDIFGQKHVGAIHGRLLTAWSAAALVGPNLLTYLRSSSHDAILRDLAAKVDAAVFEKAFGAPLAELPTLMASKTVTIPQLMQIVPPGTLDPTPTLYNTTLYSMAALAAAAMVSNALVRPVHPKHHLPEEPHSHTLQQHHGHARAQLHGRPHLLHDEKQRALDPPPPPQPHEQRQQQEEKK